MIVGHRSSAGTAELDAAPEVTRRQHNHLAVQPVETKHYAKPRASGSHNKTAPATSATGKFAVKLHQLRTRARHNAARTKAGAAFQRRLSSRSISGVGQNVADRCAASFVVLPPGGENCASAQPLIAADDIFALIRHARFTLRDAQLQAEDNGFHTLAGHLIGQVESLDAVLIAAAETLIQQLRKGGGDERKPQ